MKRKEKEKRRKKEERKEMGFGNWARMKGKWFEIRGLGCFLV